MSGTPPIVVRMPGRAGDAIEVQGDPLDCGAELCDRLLTPALCGVLPHLTHLEQRRRLLYGALSQVLSIAAVHLSVDEALRLLDILRTGTEKLRSTPLHPTQH